MIRILSRLAVENNWWSFSVNPTPTGKQFIVQPQSQWERDRERQQAKEGSAPPQPAHPQHQQVQQPQPNESPEGWTRVGKGGMPDRFTMRNHGRKPPGKAVKRKPDRQPAPKGGVVHDAVQQAVMQYGYDDELFQDWRDGKIGEKDLPEEPQP
ncbi:hypothetical protein EMIHUDRAFT_252789 [Emiliania huxleyi CCMP1516]|nr:hypothetical protein EMIHUDRAFT_252789 [Emiliania huxleyi CCMP1516]EOD34712.1 hypothetical protein EMIHUDRAFT_252789 [Emiliania huxleyi CCMP1516]|eukprot:XP_005787141.1 hypothetical protein EMIHUDRAFT_252789 [Emiliania huxleyi CCMP1516]